MKVIARDTSSNTANDTSNADFTIVAGTPTLTVTQPDTALDWPIGSVQQIKWSHTLGMSAWVSIELSRNAGSTWEVLSPSFKNTANGTGTFDWTVTGPVTTQGRVRVTWLNGPVTDTSNANFTISAAEITVSAPSAATTDWGYGTLQTISWKTNLASSAKVNIKLSTDNGATYPYTLATNLSATAKKFDVTIPTLPSATSTARVKVEWAAVPSTNGVNPIGFKVSPPFITITKPNGPKNIWGIGTMQKVSFKHNLGKLENVMIELSKDNGVTYPIVLAASTTADGSSDSITVLASWATTQGIVRVKWLKNTAIFDVSNAAFPIQ